jgi:hypothetical protein
MKNRSLSKKRYNQESPPPPSYVPPLVVTYRSHSYPVVQILEMRRTLLEKCEQVVESTPWPFEQNNLSTNKIFYDLV